MHCREGRSISISGALITLRSIGVLLLLFLSREQRFPWDPAGHSDHCRLLGCISSHQAFSKESDSEILSLAKWVRVCLKSHLPWPGHKGNRRGLLDYQRKWKNIMIGIRKEKIIPEDWINLNNRIALEVWAVFINVSYWCQRNIKDFNGRYMCY